MLDAPKTLYFTNKSFSLSLWHHVQPSLSLFSQFSLVSLSPFKTITSLFQSYFLNSQLFPSCTYYFFLCLRQNAIIFSSHTSPSRLCVLCIINTRRLKRNFIFITYRMCFLCALLSIRSKSYHYTNTVYSTCTAVHITCRLGFESKQVLCYHLLARKERKHHFYFPSSSAK